MNILVLQFREDASLEHEQKCLRRLSSHRPSTRFTFVNLMEPNVELPSAPQLSRDYDRLVLGGSGELYVLGEAGADNKKTTALKKRLYPWLKEVLELDFPTLGTCFGFQLIADCLGYPLTNHKAHRETGILPIRVTEEGLGSKLFAGVESDFYAVVGHKDSLPPGDYPTLDILAVTDKCIQAFRYRENVYATQFHSELDEKDLLVRLNMYPSYGETNAGAEMSIHPCQDAVRVMENFLRESD